MKLYISLLSAVLLSVLWGCGAAQSERGADAVLSRSHSPSRAVAASNGTDSPRTSATGAGSRGEPAGHSVAMPLALVASGEKRGELTHVEVVVRVSGALPGSVVLRVQLPEGGELASGHLSEDLGLLKADSTVRRGFDIRGSGAPVRFVATALGTSMGVTAQAFWPEPVPVAVPEVPTTPIPPVNWKGVVIDEAVPLK